MSHKPSKAYYVEGVHRFWIDEGYVVCRIECSDYYARQAQNFCGGCKEMDFLLYHPERRYESEGLEVHHIQTVASCYEKRLDGYNLLTLCERHHKMADAGKIPAKELQMIAAEQEEK